MQNKKCKFSHQISENFEKIQNFFVQVHDFEKYQISSYLIFFSKNIKKEF